MCGLTKQIDPIDGGIVRFSTFRYVAASCIELNQRMVCSRHSGSCNVIVSGGCDQEQIHIDIDWRDSNLLAVLCYNDTTKLSLLVKLHHVVWNLQLVNDDGHAGPVAGLGRRCVLLQGLQHLLHNSSPLVEKSLCVCEP
jgi:hypothetical protein